jgi:hypothetical protein
MIVTSRPFSRAEAAISAPIQPPPITTSFPPRAIRSAIASASERSRK